MNFFDTGISITTSCKMHLKLGHRGQKKIMEGPSPILKEDNGSVPRISRLLGLAHYLSKALTSGKVHDFKTLASLGEVSVPRISQIMSLLNLAPDIQEDILFLPRVKSGRSPITEKILRDIVAMIDWEEQREAWHEVLKKAGV